MSYAFQLWLLTKPSTPFKKPSRTYWYAYSRILLGDNLKYDLGSTNETTVQALKDYGWIGEDAWPYTMQNIHTKPSGAITSQAQRQKLNISIQINFSNNLNSNVNLIKAALAAGKAVLVGFYVYASFMQSSVLRSGTVPLPNSRTERLLGGHAVALTGYDDNAERFSFRNSWGSGVGAQGVFTIPYAYIGNAGLTGDVWAI
jgi:C1A family cysteine protease